MPAELCAARLGGVRAVDGGMRIHLKHPASPVPGPPGGEHRALRILVR
jgi:hypothetical protein